MNKTLLLLLTCGLLAGCTPKSDTTTTDTTTTTTTTDTAGTDAATTDTSSTDSASTDSASTDSTGTDATTTDTTTSDATAPGTADTGDSTLANGDTASTSEEADMAAGDGLEGTLSAFDADAKTMTLDEDDKNYIVNVSDNTVYEGVDNVASTADEFWGTDRTGQKLAIEGRITDGNLSADKITLQ